MRLALISDIHANFEALRALSDVLTEADQVLCLGDLVGYYCQVNEVIDYVRSLNALCLMGNHDNFLLHGCPSDAPPAVRFGIQFAERVIDADHCRWLASLPLVWGGFLGGRSFLLTHGSPWCPLNDYLYDDSPALAGLEAFDYDVVAFGQTHRTLLRVERRPFLLNPGSVGQPRDVKAQACALVVDTSTMTVERVVRPFDVDAVVHLAIQNGAREWVSKHLLPPIELQ
ncbi:MAG: metallophosphoesterase family protein [Lentisphaerae bacterium]|nr:metallophosphoesterase family protein [Lentisphaerota bacterium]